jgi:hypothetical protein
MKKVYRKKQLAPVEREHIYKIVKKYILNKIKSTITI